MKDLSEKDPGKIKFDWDAIKDFFIEAIPTALYKTSNRLEGFGEKLCHGKKSALTMPPGILVKSFARGLRFPFEETHYSSAKQELKGGGGAASFLITGFAVLLTVIGVVTKIVPDKGASLLQGIKGITLGLAAGAAAAPCFYLAVLAGMSVICALAGGIGGIPRMVRNIGTGFRRSGAAFKGNPTAPPSAQPAPAAAPAAIPVNIPEPEEPSVQELLSGMTPEERQKELENLREQFAADFDAISTKKSKGAAILEKDLKIGKPFQLKIKEKQS